MNKDGPKIKTWVLVLLLVLIIPIIGTTIGGRDALSFFENIAGNVFSPLQKALSSTSYFISEKTYPIRHVFNLSEENAKLKEALLQTRKQLIEQTMLKEEFADLKELRKAINYAKRQSYENAVACEIVARDPGNFYSMFVIDAGSDKGVVKNSMVFDADGLIGQVFECGKDWSKVITITNTKGGVSFKVLDASRAYDGIVSGNGSDVLEGFLYDVNAKVKVGDILITSGVGVFPGGVVIGSVTEVSDLTSSLLPEVKVKPSVDFKKINRVLVIPPHTEFLEEEVNEG